MSVPNKIWLAALSPHPHKRWAFYEEVPKGAPYYHIPDELVERFREEAHISRTARKLLAIIDGEA